MQKFPSKQAEKRYFETQASEAEFLEWYQKQDHPHYETPSVTVDNVLFRYNKEQDQLNLLLIQRLAHPYQHSWALPGGFVEKGESTDESCIRETFEETGVTVTSQQIEQLHTFSTPHRDPRGWVITVSYIAFVNASPIQAGDDAKKAAWFTVKRAAETLLLSEAATTIQLSLLDGASFGPDTLAFDHAHILQKAFQRILNKLYHEPRLLQLLGSEFTITEARKLYAHFLGCDYREIDHSNFKKNLSPSLKEVGEKSTGIGRPAKYYQVVQQFSV